MTPALILSIFPGIDLLGMGFERAGFTVVRGPDPLFGSDIRGWHPPANAFEGIIGGSPCQDFSKLNRTGPTGYGVAMVNEFRRCVMEARPVWFLLENVPGVPALAVVGYTVQRMHVRASEFGAKQHRLRIFQFGYCDGMPLILRRPVTKPVATEPAALATAGKSTKRKGWAEFCALQGLVPAPELESFTQAGRYQAVGNGVHVTTAYMVALGITMRADHVRDGYVPCACQCGRPANEGRMYAEVACRKRAERMRKLGKDFVNGDPAAASTAWSVTRDQALATEPRSVTDLPGLTPGMQEEKRCGQCSRTSCICDPAAVTVPRVVTSGETRTA